MARTSSREKGKNLSRREPERLLFGALCSSVHQSRPAKKPEADSSPPTSQEPLNTRHCQYSQT
ncbi:uncharacterized protein CTRU02_209972 [Colletotrichum truncatum]|uniref:Uncharacterized protein n=1 Tax=Colletotrichum truncatum TaxID=5467 RepID=A0ACC3YU22_COLTU|nr:uncharacterized protein CTRU02_02544 [Colletotrichum truncatum]KAF6798570.1 hypothetical protein CTRU02_02544 [Colletotrichum truncatum]